jgi:hypothetical protein
VLKESVRMQIEAELSKGETARANGNEGMCRVCARRAAGTLVRDYLAKQHVQSPSSTAYDLLRFLRDTAGISTEVQQVLDHLTARVDTEHNLPDGIDLIQETRWLVQVLEQ